jgi:hypothetical protein
MYGFTNNLPLLFSQAMDVAITLGVNLIWIDSLCIA